MLDPAVYNHTADHIELIETHISWVILTGQYAYKIKKPVDFGFLDFSSLSKRQQYCEQELQLNRRLAPDIYLDVVGITGTPKVTIISGEEMPGQDDVIEYAVKMKQFPQSSQLDNMLAADGLTTQHMDDIAHMIADFHETIQVADETMGYGSTEAVYQPVAENFDQINEHLGDNVDNYHDQLTRLSNWAEVNHKRLNLIFSQRKKDGYIRECHGDLHLRNMVWLNQQPMAFDCIEFNPWLRWIDVISEIAFLVMDLQNRGKKKLAKRLLNTYLEITGDYKGLTVLPFYLGYRAMVRAKVDALRLEQDSISDKEKTQTLKQFEDYLALAETYAIKNKPSLILMRGMSGSGKSTVSQQLVDNMGAIRIRSDVERKRLFNIKLNQGAHSDLNTGIYSAQASKQTYAKLLEHAECIIEAGFTVIVDAAFLKQAQREPFKLLADKLKAAFTILEVTAPPEVLRQRIVERQNDISDADQAVLEHQLANWAPLDKSETAYAISVDTTQNLDIGRLISELQ